MFKLEFDPKNALLAAAMGRALMEYGSVVMGAATARTDGKTESESNPPTPGTDAVSSVESDGNTPAPAKPAPLVEDDSASSDFVVNGDGNTPGLRHLEEQRLQNMAATDSQVESDGASGKYVPGENPTKPAPLDGVAARAETATDAQMADIAKVDPNGVPFCDLHCAKAAKPFYASGKYAGQWKKKHGVTDAAYDAWYAGELLAAENTAPPADDTPLDTASAFGDTDTPADDTPTEIGAFIKWFSEMQAANRLTQDQLRNAYAVCGLAMADIMPPTEPAQAAANIAALYTNLMVIAG